MGNKDKKLLEMVEEAGGKLWMSLKDLAENCMTNELGIGYALIRLKLQGFVDFNLYNNNQKVYISLLKKPSLEDDITLSSTNSSTNKALTKGEVYKEFSALMFIPSDENYSKDEREQACIKLRSLIDANLLSQKQKDWAMVQIVNFYTSPKTNNENELISVKIPNSQKNKEKKLLKQVFQISRANRNPIQ